MGFGFTDRLTVSVWPEEQTDQEAACNSANMTEVSDASANSRTGLENTKDEIAKEVVEPDPIEGQLKSVKGVQEPAPPNENL